MTRPFDVLDGLFETHKFAIVPSDEGLKVYKFLNHKDVLWAICLPVYDTTRANDPTFVEATLRDMGPHEEKLLKNLFVSVFTTLDAAILAVQKFQRAEGWRFADFKAKKDAIWMAERNAKQARDALRYAVITELEGEGRRVLTFEPDQEKVTLGDGREL
jgi:hypothetical protein